MEGAIWLLGIGWGYLIKKVTEYRTIKDGLLAIMHDRLYQSCTHYIQQGGIDRRPEKLGVSLQKLSRPGRQWHGHRAVQPRQGPAHP